MKPRLVWLLVAACAGAVWTLLSWGELALRSYGFFLQLIGAYVAAKEVFSNERLFDKPRLRDHISRWWRTRPGVAVPVMLTGNSARATAGTLGGTARKHLTPGDSSDIQLAKLWKNIDFISTEHEALRREVSDNKQALEAALVALRKASEESFKELNKLMEKAVVGSPYQAYFGIALVIIGGIITTWSQELHKWARDTQLCS